MILLAFVPFLYPAIPPIVDIGGHMGRYKIAADLALGRDKSKIIGVTSVLPGEGKSTIAVNLARLLANQKRRVLLIGPRAARAPQFAVDGDLPDRIQRAPYDADAAVHAIARQCADKRIRDMQ